MKITPLFNVKRSPPVEPPPGARASAVPTAGGTSPTTVSAFLTPQSLVTFPGASAAVIVLWKIAQQLVPHGGESRWVALGLALLIGMLVYLISSSDKNLDPAPNRLVSGVIAVINSLVLYSAAVGLS